MLKSLALSLAAGTLALGAAVAQPIKIRIGYPAAMNGQIIAVLEKTDIATKAGLEADYVSFQNGPPMMEALASGQLDVAITSLVPLITLKSRLPQAVVGIGTLGASTYALLVKGDAPLKALKDVKGKKIAVSFGTESHVDLLLSLEEAGLKLDDVELLNIQPAELPVALERGHADAILIRQPQVARLVAGGARLVQSWPHNFVLLARPAYIAENPKGIDAFLGSVREAVAYSGRNPEQSSDWFAQKLRLDKPTLRTVSAENPLFGPTEAAGVDLSVTPQARIAAKKLSEGALRFGIIKTKIDPDSLFR